MEQIEPLYDLTPQQIRAAAALLSGKNVTQVAEIAGVSRGCIHRWLRDDTQFIAAYNRGRKTLFTTLRSRLAIIADKAVNCVEEAIEKGDSRAALQLLKGLGVLSGKEGPSDSDQPRVLMVEQLCSNGRFFAANVRHKRGEPSETIGANQVAGEDMRRLASE